MKGKTTIKKAIGSGEEASGFYGREHRFVDLNVITCGREQCMPDKYVTAVKKDVFTVHVIESGKGYIEYNGKTVALRTHDVFIIYPGALVSYYPDRNSPWAYYWMTFEGLQAEELVAATDMTPEKPYLKSDSDPKIMGYFIAAMDAFEQNGKIVVDCVGYLYIILGTLSRKDSEALTMQKRYVKEAITYIYYNFNFDITVKDIARNLCVSPNYLSSVFRAETGMTTKQYLMKAQMERALDIMKKGDCLIKDVAEMVGYSDPLYFSKVFRNYYGKTPKETMLLLKRGVEKS